MPSQMIACPHCGAANSEKKHTCFQCQTPLQQNAPPAQRTVRTRPLRAKASGTTPATASIAPPCIDARATPVQNSAHTLAPTTTGRGATAQPTTTRAAKTSATPVIHGKTFLQQALATLPKLSTILFSGSLRHRIQFYQQLHQLLKSGIPLGIAFNYLGNYLPLYLRRMTRECEQHIQGGGMLTEVMARYPSLFPEWERSVVGAAEKSGSLPEAMLDIAKTLEVEERLRREVNTKTLHLKATAGVALATGFIQGGVNIVPWMHGVANTGVLGGVEAALVSAAISIISVVVLSRLIHYFGRTFIGSAINSVLLPRIPLFGPIIRNSLRLRFTRVLGTLWHAGVAPMESLTLAARASGDPFVIHQANQLVSRLSAGETLSDVIARLRIFPPEGVYLVRTGETSGSVAESLEKVAEYVQLDLDHQVQTLPTKLQLLFYAIIIPIVGFMVIRFWSGYFSILDK